MSIINSRGFKAEVHYVTTKDGYVLALHRIINPQISKSNTALKPILLQHGLLGSSTDWIINSPLIKHNDTVGNNLGFVLAVNGYDTWLSNSRGNTYSTNHTKLHPKSIELFYFNSC
jgi:lysosomal acid lipase/cholesteryl ester hydrolase